MIPNRPYSEVWREAAERWVDADSAARLLEETRTAVFAKWMSELGDMAVNRAEMQVKASDRWHHYVKRVVEARTHAEKLKIEMRYWDMRRMEQVSKEATERTEARLG